MRRILAHLGYAVGALWLGLMPMQTAHRVAAFRSDETIWADAVAKAPTMPRGQIDLADSYCNQRRPYDCRTHLLLARDGIQKQFMSDDRRRRWWAMIDMRLAMIAAAEGDRAMTFAWINEAAHIDPLIVKWIK